MSSNIVFVLSVTHTELVTSTSTSQEAIQCRHAALIGDYAIIFAYALTNERKLKIGKGCTSATELHNAILTRWGEPEREWYVQIKYCRSHQLKTLWKCLRCGQVCTPAIAIKELLFKLRKGVSYAAPKVFSLSPEYKFLPW
jgi:hypothetical protein